MGDIINEVNVAGTGTLDFEEFLTWVTRKMRGANVEAELEEVFHSFDKSGNGRISCSELQLAMQELGEVVTMEEVKEMIREAAAGGDEEYITKQKFMSMMTAK